MREYKNGFQEHISPGHQREGEVTCIKIEMFSTTIYCKVWKWRNWLVYLLIKIYFCPLFFFFFFFLIFFFKQITTHHSFDTSVVSPSWTEIFIGILEPRPTAQPRHTTYKKTAPVKKDLHATSFRFSLPGDEVANNRGIDSLNVSLMSYVVGTGCVAWRDTDVGVVEHRPGEKKEFVNLSSAVFVSSIAPQCLFSFSFFNIQTFKTWNEQKKKNRKE